MRKYDTLAISLLIFSVILVSAISIDPKGFSLKEWQPLIAAVIALGGASLAMFTMHHEAIWLSEQISAPTIGQSKPQMIWNFDPQAQWMRLGETLKFFHLILPGFTEN